MTDRVATRGSDPGENQGDRPVALPDAEAEALTALLWARDELSAVQAACSSLECQLASIVRVIGPVESTEASRVIPREPVRPAPAPRPDPGRPAFLSTIEKPSSREPGVERRNRRPSAAVGLLAGVGSLLMAEAVTTVVWQEPVSSVIAHQRQAELQAELSALNVRIPALATPARRSRPNPAQRARRLAVAARTELEPGKAIGRIRAPRLGSSWVVVEGTGNSALKSGPGHYPTSSLPGLPGTTAIAGHRTTYGAPFRDIDRLRSGDRITMEMPYATVEYRVEGHRVVDPSDTGTLRDIGRPRLVLSACTPLYSAAQRWVVLARQVAVRPRTMS